jgi:hypothetical protein
MFKAALFIIAPKQKQPKCPPIDGFFLNVAYPSNGILFGHKK